MDSLGKEELFLRNYGYCGLGTETAAPVRHIENPGGKQGVEQRLGAP